MKLKLLISARDTAAVKWLLPIIREALRNETLALSIVAQSPAFESLAAEGVAVRRVRSLPLKDVQAPRREELFLEADEILASERPDAILTGLSGPDAGIDEALIYRGQNALRYSVQDYDGLVVPGFDKAAPTYFVSSERASARMEQFADVKTVIVGSLPHAAYANLCPPELRLAGRARLTVSNQRRIVGFYAQPDWHWNGYGRSIELLAAAVRRVLPDALLVYRPHPKESALNRDHALRLFDIAGVEAVLDPNPAIETSLCVPDVLLMTFSSCGADQVHLQRRSDRPLGSVVYLLFEPDIVDLLSSRTGSDSPWPAQGDLAMVVRRAADLDAALTAAATTEMAAELWRRIQRDVPPAVDASGIVIQRIIDDVKKVSGRFQYA